MQFPADRDSAVAGRPTRRGPGRKDGRRGAADTGLSVARIMVRVKNAPGSLAAAMGAIAANGGNIFNMKVTSRNALFFEFIVDIEVRDVAHLQNILGALRVSDAVESVDRVREAEAS